MDEKFGKHDIQVFVAVIVRKPLSRNYTAEFKSV